jgi:glucuronate isomerase
MWLKHELHDLFGIEERLTGANAQKIYEQIEAGLHAPDFKPRLLFERFNIEVLCTTDAATDPLKYHRAIQESGWKGRILPTFRPDAVVNLDHPDWRQQIDRLSELSGLVVDSYTRYIQALENRRAYFKEMGATATDHAALTAYTAELSAAEAETIFQRALKGTTTPEDARRFTGHMLLEMARMSLDDGLVMQLHIGAYRNHNPLIAARVAAEFTRNLAPLLGKYGNESRLTLILFNLDETTYARELAPLAGHYPGLKLGPPWWFHDSLNGLRRFFDQVMETAGLYNTVGFNDDTRAFPSIPVRHDLWRRAASDWVAGLVVESIVDMAEGAEMVYELAYGLVKRAYRL